MKMRYLKEVTNMDIYKDEAFPTILNFNYYQFIKAR